MIQPACSSSIANDVVPSPAARRAVERRPAAPRDLAPARATAGREPTPATGTGTSAARVLQRDLQSRLDTVFGPGRFHVVRLEGSQAPLLVPGEQLPEQAPGEAVMDVLVRGLPTAMAQWVQVQIFLLCGFRRRHVASRTVYAQALALAADGGTCDALTTADWQAMQLRVQHAWLRCLDPAARRLGRARLRARVAMLDCRHAVPVRVAWLQVLRCWAEEASDMAALPRHADAEALCEALIEAPVTRALGQRLLAGCLLQRARLAQGEHHHAILRRAACAAEAALCLGQAPEAALVGACVALVQAERAGTTEAAALRQRAAHLLLQADAGPALKPLVQQARRAIELAFEANTAAPAGRATGGLAEHHAHRRHASCDLGTATWTRMVEARHQRGQYVLACTAAAQAVLAGRLQSPLIVAWQRASTAWGQQPLDASARRHWQANARACLVASLQCRLHAAGV